MKLLVELSDDLVAAIDLARGDAPRGPWIENHLRKLAAVRTAAKQLSITLPPRPADRRGRHSKRLGETDR